MFNVSFCSTNVRTKVLVGTVSNCGLNVTSRRDLTLWPHAVTPHWDDTDQLRWATFGLSTIL